MIEFIRKFFASFSPKKEAEDGLYDYLLNTDTSTKKQVFKNIARQANKDQQDLLRRAGILMRK